MNFPPIRELLADASQRIDPVDAEWLLLHVIDRSPTWLFTNRDAVLGHEQARNFELLVQRREQGEPVAYLTGRRGFWSLDLEVTPATLIPRPETELLVELALEKLVADGAVADLGTGSGAIALAIAHERKQSRVIATDASSDALEVAQRNARRLAIANVEFRHGEWFAPLQGERFDLIASNPPYVAVGDPHLGEGDLRFEPASALSSGSDGLDDIRIIVANAPAHLRDDGWLMLEHGYDQGDAVRALLEAAGFAEVATRRDLEGRDRVTLGRLNSTH
ncbi:peptide chain release factor N(5)-glutamine methyltransferase [Solilutibacter silvestris]|uniref:peptide chain release factor N(5)-glutamine methyltransferase n=1 Tax=Solilutibacter silvestris TaxID=1645665 RepID=UPI003D3368DB